MNCPTCGAEAPEGIAFCSTCGAQIPLSQPQPQQTYNVNEALFGGGQGGGYGAQNTAYGAPYGAQASSIQPAKKSTGGIVAAIIAIVVVAAAVVAVGFFVLGWRYNGTYEFSKAEAYGQSFTKEDLAALSGQNIDMSLKISFGKATLKADAVGYNGSGSARVTFKGNKVTFKDGSQTMDGEYISSEKTITLTEPTSGVTLYFKKK